VILTAVGSPAVTTTTGDPGPNAGQYSFELFASGPYLVSPTKTGGNNNAINSFDAAKIAAHVTGITTLSGNALIAADVTNNGIINSFDAAQIARFVTSTPPFGSAGTWKFFTVPNIPFPVGATPTSRTYPSLTSNLAGQNYTAILMGEVSGNWNNTGARPISNQQLGVGRRPEAGPERGIAVDVPRLTASAGSQIVIPVHVDGATNKGIVSYEFDLRYDPSVIQPLADAVDTFGTASRGLTAVANASEPGLLRVAIYGPLPIDSNGVLLNLRFTAIGANGSASPLTWERIMFNDGNLRMIATNGQVEIIVAEF
jgi:hypothetical protein